MASLKLAVAALVLVMAVSVNSEHTGHFLTRRAILLDDNFGGEADFSLEEFPSVEDLRKGLKMMKFSLSQRERILLPKTQIWSPIATVAEPSAAAAPSRGMVLQRQRRDTGYAPPVHHKPYTKGKVGPVYTFAKTDYNGNFKWGVRHRAGSQYAGGHH